jgi:hypothetical protein
LTCAFPFVFQLFFQIRPWLCVRFYNLKPPIDAKDWIHEVRKSIERKEEE